MTEPPLHLHGIAPSAAKSSTTPSELVGSLAEVLPVDIRIPDCPPSPQTIAEHGLAGLERAHPVT